MPPKRKLQERNEGREGNKSRQWSKKQRTETARFIKVQPTVNEPVTETSEDLPTSLDVEKFAESRAFEINAMQEAMKNASANATHRVWQTLPRHLRRRAASHDVRRVPGALREKAKTEMDVTTKRRKGNRKSQRGKESTLRTANFLLRQLNKSWLETHIWHAKRMKMDNMWGFRLAVEPTEKSFRPSYRAVINDCILHDSSYSSVFELSGDEETLKAVLDSCCDAQGAGPSSLRYTTGSRMFPTHIYKHERYPFDLIGPIDVIWQPCSTHISNSANDKAKPKALNLRKLWIRCHPMIYDEVLNSMRNAAHAYLRGKEDLRPVELLEMKETLNIFEMMGPKASQVISGALSPIKDEQRKEFKDDFEFWDILGNLKTTASAPRGMVVGCTVYDPRLNFPPKNKKVATVPTGVSQDSSPLWPTSTLARSNIWVFKTRQALKKPRYKKKDIDARKSKHLIPGTKLNPLRQDNRIPIILIQRSIEPQSDTNGGSDTSRSLHGWTIIIPKGWAMPFFSSFTHTGTRVGGQREIEAQFFESGCPFFPKDYPSTPAYQRYVEERETEEREEWERKPPAKRPSREKLGTKNPWKPEWLSLLRIKQPKDDTLVPAQRDPEPNLEPPEVVSWLLRGSETSSIANALTRSPIPDLLLKSTIDALRAKRGMPSLSVSGEALMQGCLIDVRLLAAGPGVFDYCAEIHCMQDSEARSWWDRLHKAVDAPTETHLSDASPSDDSVIGYVTSGNFSLSVGKGKAIGAIPLVKYVQLREQAHRIGRAAERSLVKVRNRDGAVFRAAYIEVIS